MSNIRMRGRREGRRAASILTLLAVFVAGLVGLALPAHAATASPPVSVRTPDGTGTTSMTVRWPAVEGTENYRVKWSTSPDMADLERYDAGTSTSATITGLARDTTYYVTVNVNAPLHRTTMPGVQVEVAPSTPPAPNPSDCSFSPRGIPSSSACALVGSSTGRTDVAVAEAMWGRSLGVRRTYYQASGVDAAVRTAKDDVAHHRIPWVSFKLPHSWAEMAAGKGDAWARGVAQKMSTVPGPVWVAFHHEPENDGPIAEWTRLQARLAPIVRNEAPNVAYTVILTGWTVTHRAEYSLDAVVPKGAPIDLLGFDMYNTQGTFTNGKEGLVPTDMKAAYFDRFGAWAQAHGMAWAVAETGMTDKAAILDPTWLSRTYEALKATGGLALTYFDSQPPGAVDWSLHTPQKQALFTALIAGKPSI